MSKQDEVDEIDRATKKITEFMEANQISGVVAVYSEMRNDKRIVQVGSCSATDDRFGDGLVELINALLDSGHTCTCCCAPGPALAELLEMDGERAPTFH